ncbi:uncharacterized protein JCM6883_006275 [Sporobolomyces salmoneus]|uniref:uncharacterized protein n=1 Tax=Sporobolomyces salmoneus TaxID=183962 RepID=UPI00318008E3
MTTELSLTGLLFVTLHSTLISTLSQLCERGEAFTLSEQVLKRKGAATGDIRIRVRALRLKSEQLASRPEGRTRWSLTVLHKPEPVRTSPLALQYSVSEIAIEDGVHPREIASALGFEEKDYDLHKRGTLWERSGVRIEVYQLFPDELSKDPLDQLSFVVQASVRFSQPGPASSSSGSNLNLTASKATTKQNSTPNQASQNSTNGGGGNSGQEDRDRALAALEGIKRALKGVVDLKRME